MIKNFIQFNESKDISVESIEEKIEDYFIDFIDEYNLDFLIQKGAMLNNVWLPESMIKDSIKLCNANNVEYVIKNGYQITFGKKDTIRQFGLEDMSDRNIDQLNNDLNKSINRMVSSIDGYEPLYVSRVVEKAWSITFYIVKK